MIRVGTGIFGVRNCDVAKIQSTEGSKGLWNACAKGVDGRLCGQSPTVFTRKDIVPQRTFERKRPDSFFKRFSVNKTNKLSKYSGNYICNERKCQLTLDTIIF